MFTFIFLISLVVGVCSPLLLLGILTVLAALGVLAAILKTDELGVPALLFFLVGASGAWFGYLVVFLFHLKFG